VLILRQPRTLLQHFSRSLEAAGRISQSFRETCGSGGGLAKCDRARIVLRRLMGKAKFPLPGSLPRERGAVIQSGRTIPRPALWLTPSIQSSSNSRSISPVTRAPLSSMSTLTSERTPNSGR